MTDANTVFTSLEYANVAFNTYVAKVMEINSQDRAAFRGRIATQKLNGVRYNEINFRPTGDEKAVYFIAQNSIQSLRQAVIDSCYLYAREAERHATQSLSSILLTAVISIISIIVIGAMISPLLASADARRMQGLQFFY